MMIFRSIRFLSAALMLGASAGWAAGPDVQLNAILGSKVIITADGEQVTLAAGEKTPRGLQLLEVRGKVAIFEWEGQRIELSPSSRISTQFEEKQAESVAIYRDTTSHYHINGEINGRSTPFLVDTGATLISLNAEQADRLGLKWREGEPVKVQTAGGATRAYLIQLDKVSISGMTVHHVEAVVTPRQVTPALLGMSFLRHFDMMESNNVLTLKKKY